jgi:AhpD family alkylhydroperoxidase
MDGVRHGEFALKQSWMAKPPAPAGSFFVPCQEFHLMYAKSNLDQLGSINAAAPIAMKAFWDFDRAVFEAGALNVKLKQIIAVAVALTTQCPYCINLHGAAAREAGATNEELAEAALVAAAIRAGGAITHATHLWAPNA